MAEPEPPFLYRHGNDVATCIDLIERAISYMGSQEDYLSRYRDLLQAARLKVYGPVPREGAILAAPTASSSLVAGTNLSNPSDHFEVENEPDSRFFPSDGPESYINQVSGYFSNSLVCLDDDLTAWYDSVLDEIQTRRS
jgi:hypothetical protein